MSFFMDPVINCYLVILFSLKDLIFYLVNLEIREIVETVYGYFVQILEIFFEDS